MVASGLLDQLLRDPIGWAQAHEAFLWGLAGASVAAFVVTLFAASWAVVRIPRDYFARPKRYRSAFLSGRPTLRVLAGLFSNLLGAVFVIMGLLMLVLPGQGILTIVMGLVLMNFPGKDRLIHYAVSRPRLLSSINSIRRRSGRKPLILEKNTRHRGPQRNR